MSASASTKGPHLHILIHIVSCPVSLVLRLPRVNDVSPLRSILGWRSQGYFELSSLALIFGLLAHARQLQCARLSFCIYIPLDHIFQFVSTQPQLLYTSCSIDLCCARRTLCRLKVPSVLHLSCTNKQTCLGPSIVTNLTSLSVLFAMNRLFSMVVCGKHYQIAKYFVSDAWFSFCSEHAR